MASAASYPNRCPTIADSTNPSAGSTGGTLIVAAALYRREKTGEGAYLDVASSDAGLAAAWMSVVTQMNRERIGADETGAPMSFGLWRKAHVPGVT